MGHQNVRKRRGLINSNCAVFNLTPFMSDRVAVFIGSQTKIPFPYLTMSVSSSKRKKT